LLLVIAIANFIMSGPIYQLRSIWRISCDVRLWFIGLAYVLSKTATQFATRWWGASSWVMHTTQEFMWNKWWHGQNI